MKGLSKDEKTIIDTFLNEPWISLNELSRRVGMGKEKLKKILIKHGLLGFKFMDEELKAIILNAISEKNWKFMDEITKKGFFFDREIVRLLKNVPDDYLNGLWLAYKYIYGGFKPDENLLDKFHDRKLIQCLLLFAKSNELVRRREFRKVIKIYEMNEKCINRMKLYHTHQFFINITKSYFFEEMHTKLEYVLNLFFKKLFNEKFFADEKFLVYESALRIFSNFIWTGRIYRKAKKFLDGIVNLPQIEKAYKIYYFLSKFEKDGEIEEFKKYRNYMDYTYLSSIDEELRNLLYLKSAFFEMILGNDDIALHYMNQAIHDEEDMSWKMFYSYYFALRGDEMYKHYIRFIMENHPKKSIRTLYRIFLKRKHFQLQSKSRNLFFKYWTEGRLNRAIELVKRGRVMFLNLIDAVIFLPKSFSKLSRYEETLKVLENIRKPIIKVNLKSYNVYIDGRRIKLNMRSKTDKIFVELCRGKGVKTSDYIRRKLYSRFGNVFVMRDGKIYIRGEVKFIPSKTKYTSKILLQNHQSVVL